MEPIIVRSHAGPKTEHCISGPDELRKKFRDRDTPYVSAIGEVFSNR
jgi:hypothetical protein